MKTKTIPFNLELAKKIQAGEIEGKIKTRDCQDVDEILFFETPLDYNVYAVINGKLHSFTQRGFERNWDKSGTHSGDLVLEVPDDEPQLNVGDTVSINIINSSYDADFRARYHSKLATVLFINKYGAGVKTISGDENYFTFDELTFVRRDAKEPQFKAFDKVLARDFDTSKWKAYLFSHYKHSSSFPYCMCGGYIHKQCIPYEGNEHLLDTTNKPKEE